MNAPRFILKERDVSVRNDSRLGWYTSAVHSPNVTRFGAEAQGNLADGLGVSKFRGRCRPLFLSPDLHSSWRMVLSLEYAEELLEWHKDMITIKFSPHTSGDSACACAYWCKLRASGEVLYTEFDTRKPTSDLRTRVATFASQSSTRAAQHKADEISPIAWVDPMDKPFKAPPDIPFIEGTELTTEQILTRTLDIVLYQGTRYIHKYMDYMTQTTAIEQEFNNHRLVHDSPFVPKLLKIVKSEGQNRGLLLEYIDGQNLSDIIHSCGLSQLYTPTVCILEALVDLEKRGYYPLNLNCANIVLRDSDNAIFVVDLGSGFSRGMDMKLGRTEIGRGELSTQMLDILGRTILELWTDEILPDHSKVEVRLDLPPLIRELVTDCCLGSRFETIADAKEAYFIQLLAAAGGV